MPRDLQRTRPVVDDEEDHPGGTEEFGSKRERVTREVTTTLPDFITPGSWAVDKRRSSSGPKVDVFKIDGYDDEVLIKFLDPTPFAPIMQHWLLIDGKRRPYVCIVNECPLCARGDTPKSSDWFNVIQLNPSPDKPALKVWYASPDPAKAIKQRAENKRTQPINKEGQYFVVSKSKGKNDIPEYHLDPVREDELGDWNVEPLTDEQLTKFEAEKYDATLVKVPAKTELTEIARNHLDND